MMSNAWARRRQGLLISIIITAGLWWLLSIYSMALKNTQWLSGWILVVLMTLLIGYNFRKKISFLRMGSNQLWLQIHLYTGLITLLLFFMHVEWRWPSGYLEVVLALVFVLICLSGIVGIVMSRRFSRRLTHHGEQLLFERIPGFTQEVKRSAEALVHDSIETTESTTLADFYTSNLAKFFARPKATMGHLYNNNRHYFRLRNELIAHERYMNAQEIEVAAQMQDLLKQKDDLDYQYSLQLALKGWLFIHIPLSYSLVLIILAHIVLVYSFGAV